MLCLCSLYYVHMKFFSLVFRDPPGGLSTVTYANVETTVKVSMESYEKYTGVDVGMYLETEIEGGSDVCVGLGAASCK